MNDVQGAASTGRTPDFRALAAVALLLAYAVPLLGPPTVGTTAGGAEAGLLARLYPGLPAGWITMRLMFLAAAAALAAWAGGQPRSRAASADGSAAWLDPATPFQAAALATAGMLAACGPMIARMAPAAQSFYVLALALPAVVLALGAPPATAHTRAGGGQDLRSALSQRSPWLLASVAVIVLWLVLRIPAAAGSARSADLVDLWQGFEQFLRFTSQTPDLTADSVVVGTSPAIVFEGAPLLRAVGAGASTGWLQVVHGLWAAATALAVAALTAVLVQPAMAPVAAAAFLFSPAVLLVPLAPGALFLPPLLVAALAATLIQATVRRSPAAMVAAATVAGLALAVPPLIVPALLAVLVLAVLAIRRPRPPGRAVAASVLCLLAAAIPALPEAAALQTAILEFLGPQAQLAVMTDLLLGQQGLLVSTELAASAQRYPLDAPFGALLAPFAWSRTAVRLVGDSLLDPLGAGLAAVGLAVCLRGLRRDRVARLLVLGLLACLLPGFVSAVGRPSLTAVVAATVPLAVLAAAGLRSLAGSLGAGEEGALHATVATVTVAIVAGGLFLFDVVGPRILPRSAIGLAISAVGPDSLDRATLLTYHPDQARWLHTPTIASNVPPRPLRRLAYDGPGSLEGANDEHLYLWSPALEEDALVSTALCRQWPEAALYTLVDRTGRSRCLAASPAGADWEPSLPAGRWSVHACARQVAEAEPDDPDAAAAPDAREEPVHRPHTPHEPTGMQRADLSRADLVGALLGGEDLTSADIRGSSLNRAHLRGANLNGARLSGSDLSGADLTGAILSAADLRGAELDGAILADAALDGARMNGMDLTTTDLAGANMHNANLSGAKLEGMDLSSVNLYGADLSEANFKAASMPGLNLSASDMQQVNLGGANLVGGDMSGANLTKAKLKGAALSAAKFVDARLNNANLSDSDLQHADLTGARLKRAKLTGADLRRSSFGGASLRKASLGGADLSAADLSGADLGSADLAGARLDDVVWSGSTCPDGTNSDTNGGTCCGHHVGGAPASCSP